MKETYFVCSLLSENLRKYHYQFIMIMEKVKREISDTTINVKRSGKWAASKLTHKARVEMNYPDPRVEVSKLCELTPCFPLSFKERGSATAFYIARTLIAG
ncbi:MAG: hypothetical protein HOC71_00450 [Candidatus Latescibacteria bacterium]|jgi:hypothetical protein|nr:hypothetical protein [Candidatus Latescibacterota bacterium]